MRITHLSYRRASGLVLVITLAALLVACGDPTATSVPATTAAATTAAATTAATTAAPTTVATTAATTAAPTTVATTAAPTTVATTAAPTTAVATTAAPTTAAATTAPAASATPAGAKELTFSKEVTDYFEKSLGVLGIKGFTTNATASDDTKEKVADLADKLLVSNGYKFAVPGQTKPFLVGNTVIGVYTKTGDDDVFFQSDDVDGIIKSFQSGGLSDAALQEFSKQLQGKKSAILVVQGKAVVAPLIAALAGATGATGTAAATTAAAGGSNSGVIPADLKLSGNAALDAIDKLTTASNAFKSVKMELGGTFSGTALSIKATIVKPESLDMSIETAGQKIGLVIIGKDVYLNPAGAGWQKITDPQLLAQFQPTIASLNQSTLDKDTIKKYAGSTVTILPDEKIDGVPVGVVEIDPSKSTDPDLKQITKIVYKFNDKFQILRTIVKTAAGDLEAKLFDYDASTNKVTAPL